MYFIQKHCRAHRDPPEQIYVESLPMIREGGKEGRRQTGRGSQRESLLMKTERQRWTEKRRLGQEDRDGLTGRTTGLVEGEKEKEDRKCEVTGEGKVKVNI